MRGLELRRGQEDRRQSCWALQARHVPEAALSQAAYAELLGRWFTQEGRENAANVARRNAAEWTAWAPRLATGGTIESIMAEDKAAAEMIDAEFLKVAL